MSSQTEAAAILMWLPAGESPTAPSFSAMGVQTYPSLTSALVAARREARSKADLPWVSTSDAIFGPDQIGVMLDSLIDDEAV